MVSEPPLPPSISAQLKYLLVHSPHPFRIEQIWSGCKNSRFSDRFTLLVPFCLDYVKWDIIYNAFYPFSAPDIVFSLDDEEFRPLLPVSDREGGAESQARLMRSSLWDWNSKDPSRLFKLVHEIRDLYVQYQRRRVGELDDARLKFEISTILSREGIEVCLISGPDKSEEVKFVVPLLDVNLNKLVHACPWKQEQKIYLQVVFPVSRSYSLAPLAPRIKLVSSSQLKDLLSVEDVKLPPWVVGMCMAEYLPSLEDTLIVQVMEAVAFVGARRRFIEALVPKFGRPLEADPIFCRKATMLAVTGVFTFLVHFSLSTHFPKQQPTLILQSSQHFNSQGAPIMSHPLNSYPWSPRWDAVEMVERILMYDLQDFLPGCGGSVIPPYMASLLEIIGAIYFTFWRWKIGANTSMHLFYVLPVKSMIFEFLGSCEIWDFTNMLSCCLCNRVCTKLHHEIILKKTSKLLRQFVFSPLL